MLLDTSAAIAFVQPNHKFHRAVLRRLRSHPLGLAGHAVFETYSVLTRLPPPQRLSAAQALELIQHNFPRTHQLGGRAAGNALATLERAGIAGGAIYDGLVALAAIDAGRLLVTCDRRAVRAYRSLGADFEQLR